tara:strand:+ start:440 stop:661 length:222 start_codon:yes stop_codon:yes gene_type:complete
MNIKKIEQEADWFMGDKDNQQHLAQYVPDLLAEVKRLREQNELMVEYFRYMRDGELTDADWITVNEWIGDDEE